MALEDVYYLKDSPICPVCGTNVEVEEQPFLGFYAAGYEGSTAEQNYRCTKCFGHFSVRADSTHAEGVTSVVIRYKKCNPDSCAGGRAYA